MNGLLADSSSSLEQAGTLHPDSSFSPLSNSLVSNDNSKIFVVERDANRRDWEMKGTMASALGMETVPEKKYYLVVDDFDDDTPFVEHCRLLSKKDKEEEKFNYYCDSAMLKYTEEMKIFQFITNVIKTKCIDYQTPPPPDINMNIFINVANEARRKTELTDPEIHQKIYQRFGLLDRESEEYATLFSQCKKDMTKEYKRWIKLAGKIIQEQELYLELADVQVEELRKVLEPQKPLTFITDSELAARQSANVFRSKLEPYCLPRGCRGRHPIDVLEKSLVKEKQQPSRIRTDEEKCYLRMQKGHLNLGFFDPLMEPETLGYIKFRGELRHPLVMSILKILERYPLGVIPNILSETFKAEHHYAINFKDLGYETFEQLLVQNDSVFIVLVGRCQTLVFPASLEINQNIDIMHKKVFHRLLTLLNIVKKPVPIKKVGEYLNSIFGLDINFNAWGVDEKLYCQTLIGEWGAGSDMEIVSVPPDENCSKTYSVLQLARAQTKLTAPRLEKSTEDYNDFASTFPLASELTKDNVAPKKKKKNNVVNGHDNLPCEGNNFVLPLKLESVADGLRPGFHYMACAELMIHPSNFFVSLYSQLSVKNNFIKFMNESYEKWQQDGTMSKKLQIEEKDAVVGVYVAVKFEEEWVRARIISKIDDNYKLLMVDLGIYGTKIKLKEIKYLHSGFVNFPEQSFSCRLRLTSLQQGFGSDNVYHGTWTDDQKKAFYGVLQESIFGLTPLKRAQMRRGLVWEVNICLLDNVTTRRTIVPDLAHNLIQTCWSDTPSTETPTSQRAMKSVVSSSSSMSSDEEIVY